MRYAVIFLILGAGWVVLAAELRGLGWLLLWPGISNLAVGAAYAGIGPRVFGKRETGTVSPLALLLLLPYTALAWLTWLVIHKLGREPVCSEIAPGLWVGRRCGAKDLPAGTSVVLDLTCELWEPSAVRKQPGYLCLPTLDGSVCDPIALDKLVRTIQNSSGTVLIHCAQGHGRSACVAAALLIARGLARNPSEAEARIAAVRPGVKLKPLQRRALATIASTPLIAAGRA